MEQATCVACDDRRHVIHWRLRDYQFVRCRTCGHIYQSPRPTEEALNHRYQQSYFEYEQAHEKAFLTLIKQGIADSRAHRYISYPDKPRLLDIGCATGALLAEYARMGWTVHGIELCAPAAEYGMRHYHVPIHIGDIDSAPFENEYFDLIHCSHVIEHIGDTRKFLRSIHTLLAPRGLLILVTPDVNGMQARLFRSRWRSAIADHVHLFRYPLLRDMASDAGFRLIRKCSWGGLAAGSAPRLLKRIADYAAKRLNIGDVMLLLLSKQEARFH